MSSPSYHPEPYWSTVAEKIGARDGWNVVAGDDEPYYRHKRRQFLRLLHEVDFAGQAVLEIGPGPGGNLHEVWQRGPFSLTGADISAEMIHVAGAHLDPAIELVKVDGQTLPFEDGAFDIVFSATVLQHNSDDAMMRRVAGEMCRVSGDSVYLFEQVAPTVRGTELRMARPVAYYAAILAEHGFGLAERKMIRIAASYYVSGAIRRLFNPRDRREGEPLTAVATRLQQLTLPLTTALDPFIGAEIDLARMHFVRRDPPTV